MERKKKVCLITPNHISTNPRLVKEAIALERAGYAVHIVFTQNLSYLAEYDFSLLELHPSWTYATLNWAGNHVKSKMIRLSSGVLLKLSKKINKIWPTVFFSCLVLNRHLFWQLKEAKKAKADLYIAHNLGALPVAYFAAKKSKVKAGFDAEDYHRHEESDELQSPEVINKIVVENAFIPKLSYFTAASPLIGDVYQKLYPRLKEPLILLNVFTRTNFVSQGAGLSRPLKIFWFSQTIGKNRGVEDIIQAIVFCKCEIELHLLGFCAKDTKSYFLRLITADGGDIKRLHFHYPVPEKEIFEIANKLDIGLATETGVPFNREICLTNKIFTYIQSGLAVVASDTLAQTELLEKYSEVGSLYKKGSASDLARVLKYYSANPHILQKNKLASYAVGQKELNWEIEQEKFLKNVKNVLN